MNKHTRKKYPNARREKIKPEKAEYADMSLFNETIKENTELRNKILVAEQRIRSLEKALEASRKVNEIAIKKAFASGPFTRETAPAHARDLNSLTDTETETLFAHLSAPYEYEKGATVERATPWRSRVVGPICALFRRGVRATTAAPGNSPDNANLK